MKATNLFWMIWLLCLIFQHGISEQQLKEKSELRPAWGLKYDFLGKMLHGLNRYHLVVGIKIPTFLFEVRDLNLDLNFCDMFNKINSTTHLFFTCNQTWPVYLESLKREQEYRRHINRIVLKQLPAVIPGFEIQEDPDDELDLNYYIDDVGRGDQRVYLGKDDSNIDTQDSSTSIPIRDNRSAMKPLPFSEIVTQINTELEAREDNYRTTMNPVESWFSTLNPTQPSHERQTLGDRFKDEGLQDLLVDTPTTPPIPSSTTNKPTTTPIPTRRAVVGRWDGRGQRIPDEIRYETRRPTRVRPTPSERRNRPTQPPLPIDYNSSIPRPDKTPAPISEHERFQSNIDPAEITRPDLMGKVYWEHVNPPNDTRPLNTTRSRSKRFISALFDLAFKGVDYYLDHKRNQKMNKAFKVIFRKQKQMQKDIVTLRKDMMSIAHTTLEEFVAIRKELHANQQDIRFLTNRVMWIHNLVLVGLEQQSDLADAVQFLTLMASTLMMKMERYLATYERLISELDHFLDALDNLSNGLLSHTVIAPSILKTMVEHVESQLLQFYPDYELVLNKVYQLYNLPFIHFSYANGTIAIQIPLFIKPRLQEPLVLFDVYSIPVPYHMNPDLVEESDNKNTYTWIKPAQELLAMSTDTYITLNHKDLAHCFKFRNNYFCEQLQLVKHNSEHTCESAIYWNQPTALIRKKCNIQYYPDLVPEPAILDAGDYLLLAGLPKPWISYCSHEDQIPNPIPGGDYVIIKKSDLCLCSITAGPWYIQENMQYCNDSIEPSTKIHLYYTVNKAVYLYLYEEEMSNLKGDSILLFKRLPTDNPQQVEFHEEKHPDVAKNGNQVVNMPLARVVTNLDKKMYKQPADKANAMNNMETWFSGDNKVFGILLIGSGLSVLCCVAGFLLYYKIFGLSSRANMFNNQIHRLWGSVGKLGILAKPVRAQSADLTVVSSMTYWDWFLVTAIMIVSVMIMYVIYRLIKYCYHYWSTNHLTEFRHNMNLTNFALMDTSKIFALLTTYKLDRIVALYVGTHIGPPELITIEGRLTSDDVSYKTGFLFDYVVLDGNLKLRIEDNMIELPSSIQISLLKKFEICLKLPKDERAVRIVSVYTKTGSIRSLTQFLTLSQPDPEPISEHSTPHQSIELLAFKQGNIEVDQESSLFDFGGKRNRGISPLPGSIEELPVRESIRNAGLMNPAFDEDETVLLKPHSKSDSVIPTVSNVIVPSMTLNRVLEGDESDSDYDKGREANVKTVQIDTIHVDVHV